MQLFLWIKAFHIIFVVCWFAGIFYLPRLFVHHAMSEDAATQARLSIMEGKLYRFVTPIALLSIGLGLWMLYLNWDFYRTAIWMHIKIFLVILLCIYHLICGRMVKQFAQGDNRGHVFYRWFNEAPILALVAVVILVVVRPF